ncbi:MAG TPA: hypothetical protein PK659_10430 [Methanothrix sp.]|nr:hypothetical protein [Methanothrix sp.]HOK59164.1 hypothetical protein [Methanothrix sp.]HOL44658.1 hypothetical protein [Methanothrix sp.]HPO89396.1 hypothetical protein [Methanothrix sp.]
MNVRNRTYDNAARNDASDIGRLHVYQVLDVEPHVEPYPADKKWNYVTMLLKHRIPALKPQDEYIVRKRVLCLQRYSGKYQGEMWTPRIGDMILVAHPYDDMPIVLGTIPNLEQEPLCRPNSTRYCYDYVHKRAQWEPPERTVGDLPDFTWFPDPKMPDCHKWWHDSLDEVWCYECPLGHQKPDCSECDNIDKIQGCTYLKYFGRRTFSRLEPQYRVKFHHRCGSMFWFDDDGRIQLENRVREDPRSHMVFWPDGDIELHTSPYDHIGARAILRGHYSQRVGEIVLENLEIPNCYIRIWPHGLIELRHGETAIEVHKDGVVVRGGLTVTGNLSVSGSGSVAGAFSHGDGPCCGLGAEGWL